MIPPPQFVNRRMFKNRNRMIDFVLNLSEKGYRQIRYDEPLSSKTFRVIQYPVTSRTDDYKVLWVD